MADTKISALTAAAAAAAANELAINEAGTSKKLTVAQILAFAVTQATYATRSAAATAARLFLPTDSYYIERDDGAAWDSYGPIFPVTPPPSTGWTWDNQNGSAISSTRGVEEFTIAARASNNISVRHRAQPATPFTITAGFIWRGLDQANIHLAGIGFRESATAKLHLVGLAQPGTVWETRWTTSASFSASSTSITPSPTALMSPVWLQISHDGTNLIFRWGTDPYDFHTIASVAKAAFFTTDSDQICFWGQHVTSAGRFVLFHWAVT